MHRYKGLNKLSEFIKIQKDKSVSTSSNNIIYKVSCNNCFLWDKWKDSWKPE